MLTGDKNDDDMFLFNVMRRRSSCRGAHLHTTRRRTKSTVDLILI